MSVCDVPVVAEVCGTVGQGAASLVAAPFDWLAKSMGSAAAWLFESVWAVFDTTTLVDLTDPAYVDVYNALFGVAVFVKLVLVVIFLVAVAQVSAPIDADLAAVSDPIAGIVLMFIAAFAPYITYKFLNFVGLDMYHAMSSEQEAKSALNRPIPVPSAPMMDSAKKVLGPGCGGRSGGTPPPTASSGGGVGPVLSAGGAVGSSSAGASTRAVAGAGAGVAAAGVAAGVMAVGAIAKAGPKVGNAVGQTADAHTQYAGDSSTPSASPSPASREPVTASASHGRAKKDA
ncbi:hypothetical protein [Cryobacterium sp. PH31-O1]|uniref:hypothetical protein n=1 Tax=Cryobacterium sp. PH31-O1 TaxID=3046306 RepID=UPI0024BA866F|nr:hypothetical protein [Cryobacterium sp. PH31-O1]MDJ0336637.1 hypothetical protein [Cryobacterium sp. PH31-O1]